MESTAKHYYEKEEYVTDAERYARKAREGRVKLVNRYMSPKTANLLELGCGSSILKSLHPNWIGLDISKPALRRVRPSTVLVCDVQNIPVRNQAIDAIISFNTLEHVHNPERVLEECCRILTPKGLLLLQAAWFCEYAHSPIPFLDKVKVVARRVGRELKLLLGKKIESLEFTKLMPDLTKIGKDWDAASSIDPHHMLCWFKSRGFLSLNERKHILQRCLRKNPFNDEALVVKA